MTRVYPVVGDQSGRWNDPLFRLRLSVRAACQVARTLSRKRKRWRCSVVEHELARVQDRPEDIVQRLLLVLLRGDDSLQLRLLLRRRLAAEAAHVQFVEDLAGSLLLRETAADQVALGNARGRRLTVEQVQRLRQRRLELDLAGAD